MCQKLEAASGRPEKRRKNAPRTLDLDIVLFGDKIIDLPELIIPHPRAAERLFVLCPLCDIAPDILFPKFNKKASELLAGLREKECSQDIRMI